MGIHILYKIGSQLELRIQFPSHMIVGHYLFEIAMVPTKKHGCNRNQGDRTDGNLSLPTGGFV
jgi:hypothetical protein